mmetsp:Transcript_23397/g.36110  ORF Transcript_23397/g.36110 Transcript_23397/m.36110 type:complete len:672 (-) Transcript_23397:2051-4066(-)|eukprot:CAMPEP_0195289570 /NCGR_PEP_ID=MMETSP0707-20130614/5788_1 /TAXON_ID=33640 /ORGANISM="Asterionellopsis glacialis, Strain CCMP134" /LENGTH=671 /DNA_ID=CAMNT_0040349591 /DNA_START=260 /DNA_END=2275 /DNA_ORIENTATION=-
MTLSLSIAPRLLYLWSVIIGLLTIASPGVIALSDDSLNIRSGFESFTREAPGKSWRQRILGNSKIRASARASQRQVPIQNNLLNTQLPKTEEINREKEAEEPKEDKEQENSPDNSTTEPALLEQTSGVERPRRKNENGDITQGPLPSFSFAAIGAALSKLLKNPQFQHGFLKVCQVSLIVYLIQEVAGALSEVMSEELSDGGNGNQHKLYVSQDNLQKLIYPEKEKKGKVASFAQTPPPPHLIQLTLKLLTTGLPLKSETGNSVEKVLSSLTRSEATLLEQTLWAPPRSDSDNRRQDLLNHWHSIAGLQHVKDALLDTAVGLHQQPAALQNVPRPAFLQNALPPGVLLYGPPGCGKTMLIKALAHTAQARTLIVMPSVLLRKYIGETNLQVRSLFSLAQKLAPCIILIDELDGVFRERSLNEHEVSRDLKTEFLQWWDGIMTASGENLSGGSGILVVGATNRPFEVDSAVLRRMPQSFFVGLPNDTERRELLFSMMKDIPLAEDISLDELTVATRAYSPSDLQQLLRTAYTLGPLRTARTLDSQGDVRALNRDDLVRALQRTKPTSLTPAYRQALEEFAQGNGGYGHNYEQQHHSHHQPSTNTDNGPTFYNMGTVHASTFSPGQTSDNSNQVWNTDEMPPEGADEDFNDDLDRDSLNESECDTSSSEFDDI